MADQVNTTTRRGGSTGLAFVVGALVVAVLVIGFFVFGGSIGKKDDANITVETPNIGASKDTGGGKSQ